MPAISMSFCQTSARAGRAEAGSSGGRIARRSLCPEGAILVVFPLPERDIGFQAVHGFHGDGKCRLSAWRADDDDHSGFTDGNFSQPVNDRNAANLMMLEQLRPELGEGANGFRFIALVLQAADRHPQVVVAHAAFKDDHGAIAILLRE